MPRNLISWNFNAYMSSTSDHCWISFSFIYNYSSYKAASTIFKSSVLFITINPNTKSYIYFFEKDGNYCRINRRLSSLFRSAYSDATSVEDNACTCLSSFTVYIRVCRRIEYESSSDISSVIIYNTSLLMDYNIGRTAHSHSLSTPILVFMLKTLGLLQHLSSHSIVSR